MARCDRQSGWLAGHMVSKKGSGTQDAVDQILRDLRRMGHHGNLVVKTDQEAAIIDLLQTVAKERGESRTVFETADRSDSKGNGEAGKAVQSIEKWCARSSPTSKSAAENNSRWKSRSSSG